MVPSLRQKLIFRCYASQSYTNARTLVNAAGGHVAPVPDTGGVPVVEQAVSPAAEAAQSTLRKAERFIG
jgi:hypothetical protein